jgi:hypothetical protein
LNDYTIASPVYTPPNITGSDIYTITVQVSDGLDTTISNVNITVSDESYVALLSENFNDGNFDGWNIVDQGTIVAPSAWSAATGQMIQSTNIHSSPMDAASLLKLGTYAWYVNGLNWTDYYANVTISSDDDDAIGIMFRYQNANNYYRFSWDKQRSYRRIIKVVNGIPTLLAEDNVGYVIGQSYQLLILVLGNTIEVSIDGSLILSDTDSTFSSGSIGLYCWGNTGARFDDVLVENLAANQAPVISSTTATPSTILDNQTSQLQVTANDPDFWPNPLTYNWIVQPGEGSVSNSAIANPVYIPPNVTEPQTYTVTIQVFDGMDATSDTVDILVGDSATQTPLPLFTDDFNDGNFNGWTIMDQGNISAPSVWSAASQAMVQSSNIHSEPMDPEDLAKLGTYAMPNIGSGWTDYTTTLTMRSDDDDAIGLMFRYSDSNNYYRFSWDKQRGYRRLVMNVGGTFTLLAEDSAAYVIGQTYQLEVAVSGNSIQVRIDGSLVFNVTDNNLSSGTIGLYNWGNAGSVYDNVEVNE